MGISHIQTDDGAPRVADPFWVCAAIIAVTALRMVDQGHPGAWIALAGGLIGLRVLFEMVLRMVLVFFRIHNRLTDIHNTLKKMDSSVSEDTG